MSAIGGKIQLLQKVSFKDGIVSIGSELTNALGAGSVVIGRDASSTVVAAPAVVIGQGSSSAGVASTVVGPNSDIVAGAVSVCVGANSSVTAVSYGTLVGSGSIITEAAGSHMVAVGNVLLVQAAYTVCIGGTNIIGLTAIDAVLIGNNSSLAATSAGTTAIGSFNVVTGSHTVCVGYDIAVDCSDAVLLGHTIDVAFGTSAVVGIGTRVVLTALAADAVAIGRDAEVNDGGCIAIGAESLIEVDAAGNVRSIAIGYNATVGPGGATGSNASIALGASTTVQSAGAVAIGNGATIYADVAGSDYAIAIGNAATVGLFAGTINGCTSSIVIGGSSTVACENSVVIGGQASASQVEVRDEDGLIVIGFDAHGSSSYSITLGYHATVPAACVGSQAFGGWSAATLPNEVIFGDSALPITVFHAVSNQPAYPLGNMDLFRFDEAGLVQNLDTDFYLMYRDNGVIKYAQVFLQVDEVEPTHGHLYVIIDGQV